MFSEFLAIPQGVAITVVEAQHQPHRRGFTGAVWPKEPGDNTWL
jgi:hypothetical protein